MLELTLMEVIPERSSEPNNSLREKMPGFPSMARQFDEQ
jgi:hypothetical protein